MKKAISISLMIFILAISLFAVEKYDSNKFIPNSIVVCFKKEAINNTRGEINLKFENGIVQTGLRSFDLLAKTYDFTNVERLYWVKNQDWVDTNGAAPMNIFKVSIKDNNNIEKALTALEKDGNLVFAEYDAIMKEAYVPNDPQTELQWHIEKVQAYQLWDFFRGDTTIVVGIVDSGTKWNHEDLRDNIWINQAELPGTTINWASGTVSGGNGVDDDGNGKVDDVIGWDFFSNDNNPYQSYNGNDHGTHVAGCVGAVLDNNVGVSSAAGHVKLMISKHQSNTQASTSVSYGNNGIYYCADTGAHIINCSWGGPGGASQANTTINYATNQGSLVLAAAGNDNVDHASTPSYPSDATNAISVAASDQSDQKSDFSDFGTAIDLISPGSSIRSTIYNASGQNTYANFDGTSMATPVAAGIAAMVKATHPSATVAQVRAQLLGTADTIEQMYGTIYENKLGSGRVNAFKAILSDIIPNLTIFGKTIEEVEGDGDNNPNPGEVIRFNMTLENEFGWIDATNINAVLRCNINGVTLIDSTLNFASITSGFQGTSTNFAKFSTPSSFNTYEIPFTLHLTANSTAESGVNYVKDIIFTVSLSLMQAGWPYNVGSNSNSSPLLIDLKMNNEKVLVFGDLTGNVHALKSDKTEVAGFPVNVGNSIMNGIAAANLTGDNKYEIVAASGNSIVKIISHDGQVLATQTLDGAIKNCPVIADVTGDDAFEIIIGTQSKKVFVMNSADLSIVSGYPVELEANIIANMATGKITGGAKDDIVVTTTQKLHVLSGSNGSDVTGWPVTVISPSSIGPSIGNFDSNANTLEIIIAGSAAANCPITIYSANGTILSTVNNPSSVKSEIAVYEANNNNGANEIAYTDYSGKFNLRTADLSPLTGFPVQISGAVECSPIVTDLNNDGLWDFIFGDNNGYLHAINSTGAENAAFPVYCGSAIKSSPTIGYYDNDEDADILCNNSNSVVFIDYKSASGLNSWVHFRANNRRSANFLESAVSNDEIVPATSETALFDNYPNPFNPNTTISFNLKQASNVKLSIYNVKGQLVNTLVNDNMTSGKHAVSWNGKNTNNKSVTSGVYFYKLETNSYSSAKKMMLIK